MTSEISIRRDYASPRIATGVLRAVSPDNKDAPCDTKIEMRTEGCTLLVRIVSDADLPSFLRTVDDLLLCLQAAERAADGAL
jgi:hypothetical protein